MPDPLQVAIFACGPVSGKLETELGYTAGAQGTAEIFHKFLNENPKVANPLNPNEKIFVPELFEIANNMKIQIFDVLGEGKPVDVKVTFDDSDPRLPGEGRLGELDAIFVSGSGKLNASSLEVMITSCSRKCFGGEGLGQGRRGT